MATEIQYPTDDDLKLIADSWGAIISRTFPPSDPPAKVDDMAVGTRFTYEFYQHLFESNPEVRSMFPDIEAQSDALAGILGVVINNGDNLASLKTAVLNLGYRHGHQYNVTPAQYDAVGANLVKTIKEWCEAQQKWDDEMTAAWVKVYTILAGWMIEGQALESPVD
ncbi:globin-like protein [Limtongia smithiae]|uniref:globin-like protein n=1 Tax=Limtongia smithiae TaxID=1125753 RepID=UPI0034CDB22E